jgi:3-isopropylmalate dehydrogenase
MPSASFGSARNRHGGYRGIFEPIHGTAPDIAGKQMANPVAAIQSLGLLLRYGLNLEDDARTVEAGVEAAIASGLRTPDIARPDERTATTSEIGDAIAEAVRPGARAPALARA